MDPVMLPWSTDYASLWAGARREPACCRPALHGSASVVTVRRPAFRARNPAVMAKPDPWVVHKFGGSSVADADCFRRVATILEAAAPGRLAVVLSACKGVTDALLRLVALAERQDEGYYGEIEQLRARHAEIADAVLSPAAAQQYRTVFDQDCLDLEGILHAVKLTR